MCILEYIEHKIRMSVYALRTVVECMCHVMCTHFPFDTCAPGDCACDTPNNTSADCSQSPCRGCGLQNKFIPPKEQICRETQTSKVTPHKLRDSEMPCSGNPYAPGRRGRLHPRTAKDSALILYIFGEQIVG